VPFGILVLALMGLAASQMLYKMKMNLMVVTAIVVVVTLAAMILGPLGNATVDGKPVYGFVSGATVALNGAINSLTGNNSLYTVVDPTNADPRIPAPGADGKRATTAVYNADTGEIKTMPAYLFWALFLFVFSYLGANLPIWRFAQPVNYIGFWVTLITILLSALGAVLAPLTGATTKVGEEVFPIAQFVLPAVKDLGFTFNPTAAWQPIWPMLFVTIACGAISGWHALFGSVGTARQLEYETDALPVGGGAMFSENTLALLSLVAVSIAGVGKLLYAVTFNLLPEAFGTALGFGAFVVIVLTVVQLVFRVMRVTLTEWVGEMVPAVKNMHVSTVISMIFTLALVLTGTWVYLWQLFGASNQLMAALSLLLVTVWLKSEKRNPAYALWPMLFMYFTTLVATAVTARNLFVTIAINPNLSGVPIAGAWAMIVVSLLLIVAALMIGYDGWQAYQRYAKGGEAPKAAPAPGD
jgi:carbon starvation protein